MSDSWLDKLDDLLGVLDEGSIGENRLSLIQMDLIYTNIIKPYNLTSKMLLDQILHKKQSMKNTAFFVLEAVIFKEPMEMEKQQDFVELCSMVSSSLDVPDQVWNWLVSANSHKSENYFYYRLRLLCALIYKVSTKDASVKDQSLILNLLASLSYHMHPKLPWTSELNSKTIENFIANSNEVRDMIHSLIPLYISKKLKPELLNLSSTKGQSMGNSLSNPKTTPAGYAIGISGGTRLLHGGLRPKLGYGGTRTEIIAEDQRQAWKSSTKVKSISMIWFVIYTIANNEYLDQFWPLVTSFILNLFDDHDPLMKAQSCELLNYFMLMVDHSKDYKQHILLKTGLIDLFIESCKTCLTYLPNLTPSDQSCYLLSIAYPTVVKLCVLNCKKEANFLSLVELINGNILSSVTHIHNRNGPNSNYPLLSLLFNQLEIIIKYYLKTNVLICLSRLNFTINQVMSNPDIFEQGIEGINCINSALNVQSSILQSFKLLNDREGLKLILNYKYDFLAVWTILQKRLKHNLVKRSNVDILGLCDLNCKLLIQLSKECQANEFQDLQTDLNQILKANPGVIFPLE